MAGVQTKHSTNLKSKHKKRLYRYIEEDNRSKFKSYTRKHKIDVETVNIGASEKLIHQVCFRGSENIMRYDHYNMEGTQFVIRCGERRCEGYQKVPPFYCCPADYQVSSAYASTIHLSRNIVL